MALDSQQRRVARKIYRVGRREGANRNQLVAALMTGWVESGFRNPTMAESDSDSAGWRQERSHYGPESNRRNVGAAARRFFEETRPYRNMKPGELAQTVQRSAFPDRYRESRGQALDVFGWLKRTEGRDGADSRPPTTRALRKEAALGPGGTQGLVELARQLRAQSAPQVQSAGVAPPSFSAGPNMPAGRQEPLSSGVVEPSGGVDDLLKLVGQATGGSAEAERSAPSEPGSAPRGGTPQIGKDGYHGTHDAFAAVYDVAKRFGVGFSSEKRDKKYTATGNISDHWIGNKQSWAGDLDTPGLDTAQGAKIASRVAKRYGVKFRLNSYDSGGTFKVGRRTFRIQILYGSGVDHADHVHVGISRVL